MTRLICDIGQSRRKEKAGIGRVTGSNRSLLAIYRSFQHTVEPLALNSRMQFGPGARPIDVTFPDPIPSHSWSRRSDMTKWALLRAFDKFEPDWKHNALILVSTIPDPADGAPRTP
jgi:hypothetical protein